MAIHLEHIDRETLMECRRACPTAWSPSARSAGMQWVNDSKATNVEAILSRLTVVLLNAKNVKKSLGFIFVDTKKLIRRPIELPIPPAPCPTDPVGTQNGGSIGALEGADTGLCVVGDVGAVVETRTSTKPID